MNFAVILVVIVIVIAAVVAVIFIADFSPIAIAVTIKGDDISTAYEVDASVDDNVEVHICFHVRPGVLPVLPLRLKHTAEEILDHGHLLLGG